MTAALGYVIWDNAKNEEVPFSRYREHRVCRYKPKAAVRPDHTITKTPSRIPICDIAKGIARVPAPITVDKSVEAPRRTDDILVLTRLTLLLIQEACPPKFWSFSALLDRRLVKPSVLLNTQSKVPYLLPLDASEL